MTCTVNGCSKPSYRKELCTGHYQRLRNKGDVLAHIPLRRSVKHTACIENGCSGRPEGYGYCRKHYKQHKNRDTLTAVRFLDRRCSIEDCGRPHYSRGLCEAHYHRFLRDGDSRESEPVKDRACDGSGYVSPTGYRIIYREHPNANSVGAIAEHRFVVAEYLKRPLLKGEEVHHRNGVRVDNTVGACVIRSSCDCTGGPHNLELWSKSQPAGQRVSDKIRWAEEILATYVHEPQVVGPT